MSYTGKQNMDNKYTFLEHRREQEREHFERLSNQEEDPIHSLLTVEVNTTELCNRTCVFCPRHNPEVFPNRNLHMTPKGAGLIAKELARHKFIGKISFSGFGENLLNPKFNEIVESFRNELPDNVLECNTNGDHLNSHYAHDLFDKGLTLLYINLYDGPEQFDHFDKIMQDIPDSKYRYRMHWSQKDHGLILNNRSGTIDWLGIEDEDITKLKGTVCHYPFYKMFVDWNGDVLFCSNDWGREHVVGNVIADTLDNVWLYSKPLNKIRRRLASGDRSHSPCNRCSIKGTLFGKKSFDIIARSCL